MAQAFHEVRFPLRVSLSTTGGPVRRTDIVNLANGREARNQRWFASRRKFDAGSGVKSLSDLYTVLEFFEARGGELYGFRFRDPLDFSSSRPGAATSAMDQFLGNGDGQSTQFQLVKTYGDSAGSFQRTIAKPVSGTLKLSLGGVVLASDAYTLESTTGILTLKTPPAAGVALYAGFEFDVPVRFDTDTITVNLDHFSAGSIPSIPLIEISP